jgi:hypothetical protein
MAEEAVALFRNFYEQGNPNGLFFYTLEFSVPCENVS